MPERSDSWLSRQLGRPYRLVALVVAAALLSVGALVGVAASAGFDEVWQTLIYPRWYWLPIAVAGELFAGFVSSLNQCPF